MRASQYGWGAPIRGGAMPDSPVWERLFAQALTPDYDESSRHVKFFLDDGEIDIVVAEPLTPDPHETVQLLGRPIVMEKAAEIVAKKLWHRGFMATARDLFDLAAVASRDPEALDDARPWLGRHARVFLDQLDARGVILAAEFDQIDRLDFDLGFDECAEIASSILEPIATDGR